MSGVTAADHARGVRVDHSTASHTEHLALDTNGYTDTNGNFISLRDAPNGLATGVTGVSDSGDVTLYNQKTNEYHTIIKGTGNPKLSREFVADHNKQLMDSLIVEDRPEATVQEIEAHAKRAAEREQETKDGYHVPHG